MMLIGPILYIRRECIRFGKLKVIYVPDYSKPGVSEAVKSEVDEIEALCYDKRKL